jgi:hypothetical protein
MWHFYRLQIFCFCEYFEIITSGKGGPSEAAAELQLVFVYSTCHQITGMTTISITVGSWLAQCKKLNSCNVNE